MDHVHPISLFDVSDDEELEDAFNWMNTQTSLKEDHQRKRAKFDFFAYRLQFLKANQFLKLNGKGFE